MKKNALICLLFSWSLVACAQELEFVENGDGVLLLENGQPRLFYQSRTKSLEGKYPRANYLHPLYGLNGEVLTEDFPKDHLHQRGIYWAWHQLYQGDQRLGNGWLCENFVWDVRKVFTSIEEDRAYLKTVVFWMDESGEEYVIETMEMIYKRLSEDAYELDFDIRLQAVKEDIYLGGSEDNKGYGGFSARLRLPDPIAFESEKGKITPTETPVNAGDYVSLFGQFDPEGNPYYITLSGETEELNGFQGWILREKESMQNLAFPGRKLKAIPMDEPIRMQNKVIVHKNKIF